MPSYVVTGASRGIGLEFVRQLGADPANKVFALVRNKAAADHLAALEGKNVHIFQADVTDHKALKAAAVNVSQETGGKLDVLINNAAAINGDNDWRKLTDYDGEEETLEKDLDDAFKVNVLGVIHTTNAFLPLLREGSAKKVITIGSGGGEREFVFRSKLDAMVAYGTSKAAAHMIVTKYAVQLGDEGFIFIALSPGLVDTSSTSLGERSEKNKEWLTNYMPNLPKMISPTESVEKQLKVIAGITEKDNGSFLRS